MDIIRVSMLGMCGVIMGFFLKGTRAEYTAFITMGIGIMILGLAVGKLEYLFRHWEICKKVFQLIRNIFIR